MAANSFKNYLVRYDVAVNIENSVRNIDALKASVEGFVGPAENLAKSLATVSGAIKKVKESASIKFEISSNIAGFQTQLNALVRLAREKGAEAAKAYQQALNGAVTGKGAAAGAASKAIKRDLKSMLNERKYLEDELKKFEKTIFHRPGTAAAKKHGIKETVIRGNTDTERKLIRSLQDRLAAVSKEMESSKISTAPVTIAKPKSAPKAASTAAATLVNQFGPKWIKDTFGSKKSATLKLQINKSDADKKLADFAAQLKNLQKLGIISVTPTMNMEAHAIAKAKLEELVVMANAIRASLSNPFAPLAGQKSLTKAENQQLTALQNRVAANEIKRGSAKGSAKGGLTTSINRDKAKISALLAKSGGAAASAVGQANSGLNATLAKMQQVADTKPIRISTVLIPNGQAGFGLRMDIFKLQELANTTPVRIPVVAAPVAGGKAGGGVQRSIKSKGTTGIQPLPVNEKNVKGTKAILSGISAANVTKKTEALARLNSVLAQMPPSLDRNYTIKLSVTGIDRKVAQLERLIPLLSQLPANISRNYSVAANGSKTSATGTTAPATSVVPTRNSYISASGYGNRAIITPRNARKVSMNSLGYQIFGNTSFGARTPMFLDMMKGMGVMTGVGAAMSTISNAFTHAAEYQNTMLTAQAILKENYKGSNFYGDFKEMTGIVRDVAKRTKFTAPQAADAARFMAMAGLNIPMINAAISPIADVAVIGDNDLGEVADKMTNIMTAFNLKPQNMRHLADALTKTFTSTNTDMMMLAESMQYAAPMAHLAGADVEEALAMIGIMGNAGIQGSMAGTTLRMMYQNIIKPNKNQAKMWESLGIKTTDANGHTRNILDILSDLRGKLSFKGAKDMEGNWKDEGTPVAKAVSELFRVTASAGAGTLLENLDKVKSLVQANRAVTGLSESVSQVKQNDVKGLWNKLTSAFTDAVVTEFESSDGVIKKYLGDITKYLASDEFKGTLHEIFDLVVSLANVMGKVAKVWRFLIGSFGGLYKYILQAQFFIHQVGFLLTPFRQMFQLGARTLGAFRLGGSVVSAGSVAAGGAAPILAQGAVMAGAARGRSGDYIRIGSASNMNPALRTGYQVSMAQQFLRGRERYNFPTYRGIIKSGGGKALKNFYYGRAAGAADYILASSMLGQAYLSRTAGVKNFRTAHLSGIGEWFMRAENRQRLGAHSTGASAVLLGGSANPHLAAEYAKRAESYRYAYLHTGSNTARTNWKAYEQAAARANEIQARANRIYGFGGRFTRGFTTAATWTPTLMSMGGITTWFKSMAGTVGKCLGALVNPLTLTAAAVGGVLLAFNKMGKNIEEANRRFNAQNKRDVAVTGGVAASLGGRTTVDVINDRSKIGAGPLQLGLIKPLGQTQESSRYSVNPMLRNTKGVASIFRNADADDFIPYATQLLSDMSPMIYGKKVPHYAVSGLYERTNAASGSYKSFTDKEALQKDAVKAALMLVGATSPEAKAASSSIIAELRTWEKITDKEQSALMFQQIMESARQAAAKFNPAGRNLTRFADTYSVNEIGSMRSGKAMTSYEAQLGAYNAVMDITNPNSPLYGRWAAINELRNVAEVGTQQWYDNVAKIAGAMQMQVMDKNGNVRELLLQFDNSRITWEAFQSRMAALNIQVDDDIATYQGIIVQAYQEMKGMVDKAGAGMVSIEQFVDKHGIKLPKGWALTMTPQQLTAWQRKVINNWDSNAPAFQAIRKKYGDQKTFVNSTNGVPSGWGPWAKDNRPTDAEVEGVENTLIKMQLNEAQKGKGGGNKDQAYAIPQTVNQKPYSGANYMPQSKTGSANGVNVNIDMNGWSVGSDANTREIAQAVQDAVVNAMTVAIG